MKGPARRVMAEGMTGLVKHVGEGAGRAVLAILSALVIGLGVPSLWVWIGSILQGGGDGTTVSGATAAVIFVGIVLTYIAVLSIAGWVQGRRSDDGPARGPSRHPWNRSMRDEPYRPGERRLSPLETAFVFTAVLASAAFMIWFFVLAGSPLPSG
jgi:hypothetical protein